MRSPVNPIAVAKLCMEEIESTAIDKTETPPKICGNDTLMTASSLFTKTGKRENNGQIAVIDTLFSHEDGTISVDVYRKPTNTDRYLDFESHHDK